MKGVCAVQRCSANASEHWIYPLLLIRAQQGRIKDPTPVSAQFDFAGCSVCVSGEG